MYGKVVHVISLVLSGLCVLFTLVMGVLGSIVYNKHGFYPFVGDIFNALTAADIDAIRKRSTNDVFSFMGGTALIPAAALLIQYILAVLMNFSERIVKPIISILINVGSIVLVFSPAHRLLGKWIVIVYIALFAGLVWCFIGTKGGILFLISLGALLFHWIFFPFILLVLNSLLGRIILIVVVLAGILLVVLFRFAPPEPDSSERSRSSRSRSSDFSSVFGSSGYSSGTKYPGSSGGNSNSDIDKEAQKIKNEIALRRKNIDDTYHAISEHKKGAIGYMHIDEKACLRKIASEEETIKILNKQLNKLESKKK